MTRIGLWSDMVNWPSPPRSLKRASDRQSTFHRKLTRLPAFAVKLAAAHQPTGYIGRLQQRPLSREVRSEIPCDGNKDMPALVAVAPLAELPHAGLEHLVGMETCVFPEQRLRKGRD